MLPEDQRPHDIEQAWAQLEKQEYLATFGGLEGVVARTGEIVAAGLQVRKR